MKFFNRIFASMSVSLLVSVPSYAQDLSKIIVLQQAEIQELKRAIPKTWHAQQKPSSQVTFVASETWQDIPALQLDFEIKERSNVKLEFDGTVYAYVNGVHCGLGFRMNGVNIGHPTIGDAIFMGEAGNHWQTVTRSRMLYDLAPGKYSITLAMRAWGGSAKDNAAACYLQNNEEYSRFNIYATANKI